MTTITEIADHLAAVAKYELGDWWFWSTPQWREYSHAYNPNALTPVNFADGGNLVVMFQDEMQMWKALTKGHRAAVRRAEKSTSIVFDTDGDHFDVYQMLHELDAGKRTRPQKTFDLMRSWIESGNGLVAIAHRDRLPIGAAFFILYEQGAYYASVGVDPSVPRNDTPTHLILWKTMCRLANNGYKWLDLGPLTPNASEKVVNIERFKRHMGAEVKVWPYVG